MRSPESFRNATIDPVKVTVPMNTPTNTSAWWMSSRAPLIPVSYSAPVHPTSTAASRTTRLGAVSCAIAPTMMMPEMAFVTVMSGVCRACATFPMTSKPITTDSWDACPGSRRARSVYPSWTEAVGAAACGRPSLDARASGRRSLTRETAELPRLNGWLPTSLLTARRNGRT